MANGKWRIGVERYKKMNVKKIIESSYISLDDFYALNQDIMSTCCCLTASILLFSGGVRLPKREGPFPHLYQKVSEDT